METKEMVDKLNNLIQLDHDAVGAYQEAIDRIDVESISTQLRTFQSDHRRHIEDLSHAVKRLGGTPKERGDIKGFFIKGFTAISSAMGNEAALKAMKGNEHLTNKTYTEALKHTWTDDIRMILEKNLRDEQRHLAYIEDALRNRIWEQAAHP